MQTMSSIYVFENDWVRKCVYLYTITEYKSSTFYSYERQSTAYIV